MSTIALAFQSRTFRSLQRHRNYRLFFAGQIVSLAGTWMQNVALAWLVLSLSRSPVAVGLLLFFRLMPYTILGLFAGPVIDRFETRRLVIWTQAASMVVSAAIAVVTITGVVTLPLAYALAALGGVTLVLDAPGRQSLTFAMVGRSELPNAVALNSGLLNASRVIGPALAGVVIAAVGVGACFVLNTLSFLAVLVALLLMHEDELYESPRQSKLRVLAGTREGLVYAWRTPQVRAVLLVVTTVSLVGFNFNTLVPLLASSSLHVDSRTFGLLSAAFGAGALAGAIATASLGRASFRGFVAGVAGFSLLMLGLGFVHTVAWAAILLAGVGAAFSLFGANANALVQLAAPDQLRGRVVALYMFAFAGLAPLGALLSGWLVDVGGPMLAFGIAGASGLAVAAWASVDRLRARAALEPGAALERGSAA